MNPNNELKLSVCCMPGHMCHTEEPLASPPFYRWGNRGAEKQGDFLRLYKMAELGFEPELA